LRIEWPFPLCFKIDHLETKGTKKLKLTLNPSCSWDGWCLVATWILQQDNPNKSFQQKFEGDEYGRGVLF
jgi:hypothetical protein